MAPAWHDRILVPTTERRPARTAQPRGRLVWGSPVKRPCRALRVGTRSPPHPGTPSGPRRPPPRHTPAGTQVFSARRTRRPARSA